MVAGRAAFAVFDSLSQLLVLIADTVNLLDRSESESSASARCNHTSYDTNYNLQQHQKQSVPY